MTSVYDVVIKQTGSNTYVAVDPNNNQTIFSGSCSSGSGTCGIYEAIQYIQQNYNGIGEIGLVGNFYPVSSPTLTTQSNDIIIAGDANIYLNPSSVPFFMTLQYLRGICLLWYNNIGVVNTILKKRNAFSLNPYVLFTSTVPNLIFANGQYALGTLSQFTISAWVDGKSSGYYGGILAYGNLNGNTVWSLHAANNTLYFDTPSGSLTASYPSQIPFHVAIVYNNGTATMYVNGFVVATKSLSIQYPTSSSYPIYLWVNNYPIQSQQGGINPNTWFATIENIQFYNTALSSQQISQLASSVVQDPIQTPVFWSLYRYIMYLGDLMSGIGYQRMTALSYSGVI